MEDSDENFVFLEPREVYDPMILGVSVEQTRLIYDKAQILAYHASLSSADTEEDKYIEALEYFDYNMTTEQAPNWPIYLEQKEYFDIFEIDPKS